MNEPVAWLIPGCITRDKELAEVNKAYAEPLYLHPDPRVDELEAVLRECREALLRAYVNCPLVLKIDEVLR